MSTPPTPVRTAWTTSWSDVLDTGTWRAALPVHEWRPSPCHVRCPIGNAIPSFIGSLDEDRQQEAWEALVATNPFPAVTGRVCAHPCETDCNRTVLEGAVGINGLEQFLGDRALAEGWTLPVPNGSQGKRVAVVGGGPGGLSAAYHLRMLGYGVTVFEAGPRLGGLLVWGIPEYRLPADVVEKEIGRILALGVEARTDTAVADDAAFARLRDEYDAVFVAVGAGRAKRLPYLDEMVGQTRVLDGLDYLRRVRSGEELELGQRVVVIGGGSAAVDVARTARRHGKDVTLVALETRDVLPAQEGEVVEALEEGIALVAGAMVERGRVTTECLSLECRLVTLDPDAPAGTIRPLPVADSDFLLEADTIIAAIGQDPVLDPFASAFKTDGGLVVVDPDALTTSEPDVFAGGDVSDLTRFVSTAIGAGRRAAYGIAASLGHPDAAPLPRLDIGQAVGPTEVNPYYFPPADRVERTRLGVEERVSDFREVTQGYTLGQAAQEASRCMSCGTCVECDNCFIFCPDMAIRRAEDAGGAAADEAAGGDGGPSAGSTEPHYLVLTQYCKGCGLCVTECPRGAVRLKEEVR